MPEPFQERRRFPRTTVAGGHELKMPLQMTVQLVDISSSGVLLASPQGWGRAAAEQRRSHFRST